MNMFLWHSLTCQQSDANPSLSCITCTRSMTRAFGLFDHLAYKRPSVGPIRQCASGLFLRACRSQTLVRSFSSSSCIWCILYIIVSYTVSYCALKDARFFKVSCCFKHLVALKLKHVQSGKHFTLVNIRPLWKGVCPSKNAWSLHPTARIYTANSTYLAQCLSQCLLLSISNFWEKGLLADWPKIQWCRTQHSTGDWMW